MLLRNLKQLHTVYADYVHLLPDETSTGREKLAAFISGEFSSLFSEAPSFNAAAGADSSGGSGGIEVSVTNAGTSFMPSNFQLSCCFVDVPAASG